MYMLSKSKVFICLVVFFGMIFCPALEIGAEDDRKSGKIVCSHSGRRHPFLGLYLNVEEYYAEAVFGRCSGL